MSPDDAHEVYDRMAAAYATSNPDSATRAGYEWPAVREALPPVEGRRVLDAGCGTGHFSALLRERGADVVGVDASIGMLRAGRERRDGPARALRADLRTGLPFPDAAFDVVVSQLTLDHIERWEPVVGEFSRVLRAGGALVLSVDHPFTTYFVIDQEPAEVGNAEAEAASYLDVERFEKEWAGESMPTYRRPLQGVVGPLFDAGFAVTGLREPEPTVEAEHLEYFEERTPRFLVVRAVKR